MDAMGAPDPYWPPWLIGEVLETGQITNDLVRDFSDRFQVTGDHEERSLQSLGPGKGPMPYLGTEPPGWT